MDTEVKTPQDQVCGAAFAAHWGTLHQQSTLAIFVATHVLPPLKEASWFREMGPPYSPTKTGCWNSVIWPEFCTVLNVWFLRHEWRRGSMWPSVSWKRSRRWWGHSGMCWLPIGVRWIELQLWAGFPSAGLDGRLFGFACVKMGTGPLW